MVKNKSITRIIFLQVFGLICFFFMLYLANIFAIHIRHPIFNSAVIFLNSNIPIIVIMSVIFLIADLFSALWFPLNLPYPFFSAFGNLFVTQFIFRSFALLDLIIGQDIFKTLGIFSFIVYPIIFVIVLVGGYIKIFKEETEEIRGGREKRSYIAETWGDIESEFKQTIYDFLKLIRKSINSNRKTKSRKGTKKRHKKERRKR